MQFFKEPVKVSTIKDIKKYYLQDIIVDEIYDTGISYQVNGKDEGYYVITYLQDTILLCIISLDDTHLLNEKNVILKGRLRTPEKHENENQETVFEALAKSIMEYQRELNIPKEQRGTLEEIQNKFYTEIFDYTLEDDILSTLIMATIIFSVPSFVFILSMTNYFNYKTSKTYRMLKKYEDVDYLSHLLNTELQSDESRVYGHLHITSHFICNMKALAFLHKTEELIWAYHIISNIQGADFHILYFFFYKNNKFYKREALIGEENAELVLDYISNQYPNVLIGLNKEVKSFYTQFKKSKDIKQLYINWNDYKARNICILPAIR